MWAGGTICAESFFRVRFVIIIVCCVFTEKMSPNRIIELSRVGLPRNITIEIDF